MRTPSSGEDTPQELKSLTGASTLLRPGRTPEQLKTEACALSDNQALTQLYAALEALFLELLHGRMTVA